MNKADEKRVREIIREELDLAMGSLRRETTALAKATPPQRDNGFSSTDRPKQLPIDDLVDALEEQAFAPVAQEYQKRRDLGMSKALAEVKAKLAQGMDLTPLAFGMPSHSYFGTSERRVSSTGMAAENVIVGGVPGFREHYIKLIEDGGDIDPAYEETCQRFNVPALRKAGPYASALAELPDAPRGGFQLGRGEAEQKTKTGFLGRLLGRGEDEED